jgi:3'(2'), 5'-bisphosphate nucleotidase
MGYERELQVAIEAVREATVLCRTVREEMVVNASLEKADRSPVTIADFGSQALVCRRLKEAFTEDPIVAEEDAETLRQSDNVEMAERLGSYVSAIEASASLKDICQWIDYGNGKVSDRYWTLDPIDGTKGFLRNDQYAVALALIERGEVKVGVLGCPALRMDPADTDGISGIMLAATRGAGTMISPLAGGESRAIRVNREQNPEGWRFVESVESGHGDHDLQSRIAKATGIDRPSLRMDSQAKYAAVARGEAILYLRLPSPKYSDYHEKIWDHAAGSIVVEEAGGTVTDMHGNVLDFGQDFLMKGNKGVVVSNGVVHDAAIKALAEGVRETLAPARLAVKAFLFPSESGNDVDAIIKELTKHNPPA